MDMNDDILISYLLGETNAEQTAQVDAWRKSDKANNTRFEQFNLIWQTSKNIKFTAEVNAQLSLQSLKQKAAAQKEENAKVVKLRRSYNWLKVAAAIILLTAGTWLYLYQRPSIEIKLATHKEVKTDTLSDGSIVTLNKASILKYPEQFSGDTRKVVLLKGEAFFNVAHNKAIPFIISTCGTTIRVVGTAFNIKNKAGDVEVIVETGIVEVSRNGYMVTLKAGEKTVVKQGEHPLIKETNADQLYTYYRSKEFVAINTPLRRMVEILNEAYGSNIIISRKELNDLPLNTTFKNESLDDILAIISRTFSVTVEKRHNQVIIK
ncbi:MAG: DUF4974 domain-containing protein [Sphingobacteriaceae bacterium]|nr:MAG: DUF4974 domain-containing protein [Sphingobacteriaceae bacterium]